MIVDSSALVAVVFREPGFERVLDQLARAENLAMAAPSLLESGIVIAARLQRPSRPIIERFLSELSVDVIPFGDEHWKEALDAWRRFGKGHHPAALNFGDCISYAAARLSAAPLLFVGEDFSRTDVEAA